MADESHVGGPTGIGPTGNGGTGNGGTEATASSPPRAPALALIDGHGEVVRLTESFRAGFAPEGSPHVSIWDFLADPDQRSRLGRVLEGELPRADLALPSATGSVAAEAQAVLDGAVTRHALLTVARADPDPEPRSGADVLLDDASVDVSSAIVWITDLSGRYLRINRRYTERLNIDGASIRGKTAAELSPAHVVAEPHLHGHQGGGGEPVALEYTVEAAEGREALTVLRFPIHDLDGGAVAVCGVAAAVADAAIARSEAERLLRIERWAGLSSAAIRAEVLEEWQIVEVTTGEEPAAITPGVVDADTHPAPADLDRVRRELDAALAATAELENRAGAERAAKDELERRLAEVEAALESARAGADALTREAASERAAAEARGAAAERELAVARARVDELERARAAAAAAVPEAGPEPAVLAELERRVADAERRSDEAARILAVERAQSAQVQEELTARAEQAEVALAEARAAAERATAAARRAEAAAELARGRAERREAGPLARPPSVRFAGTAPVAEPVPAGAGPRWSHEAQRTLSVALADAAEWRAGLKDALRILGTEGGWDVVIAWCPDERASALRCAAMWMAAPDQHSLFETVTWQRRQSPTVSLVGRAAVGDRASWLTDLGSVEDTQLTAAAGEGMRAALLVPLRHAGETSGVLELLTRARGALDPGVSAAMEAVALQLAHFDHLLRQGAEPRWRLGRL